MMILFWSAVALVSTLIVWVGSQVLERSSERLSIYYELPDIVKGAVVVAVGSSFPELSTTVLSTLVHGKFDLGVAAIAGSALFNILVIPGLSALVGKEQLQSNRDLVYKEAQFYMIAVAVLLLTFSFAVIYHPTGETAGRLIKGDVTRWLAMIPIGAYVLYVFVQYQDTMDYEADVDKTGIRPVREWGLLLLSLGIIVVGVDALVHPAVEFRKTFNTPSFLWGITVVAAGTSVPDAFVSVYAARRGKAVTSLANVLGSNVFDLLVCIPAGVLVAGAAEINYSVAAPLLGLLTLGTVVLFAMMRTRMVLSRWEGWALIVLYGLFVIWIAVETLDVVDWLPSIPPPA